MRSQKKSLCPAKPVLSVSYGAISKQKQITHIKKVISPDTQSINNKKKSQMRNFFLLTMKMPRIHTSKTLFHSCENFVQPAEKYFALFGALKKHW